MKAVIISGGKAPSDAILKSEIENSDIIICADSGADCLYLNKIVPNYLIGDFDSIDLGILEYFKNSSCEIIKYPSKKDFTDTFLAVDKAIQLNATEIILLGCTGSRIDHFIGNINILNYCLNQDIKAVLKDDNNEVFLKRESFILKNYGYKYFSLLAFSGTVFGLTLNNAKYQLDNYNLSIGDSLTISNEFIGESANIKFNSGTIVVILSKD
ncbi:MAG: hypothetical protein K0R54_3941 [Clostridiaceae bacterium]|jgi:thiamine pyrophosphokinase|nr:hypothetical protein [Clostridiaceae bacterium]